MEPFLFFSNYERRFYDTVDFYEKFYRGAQILGAKKLILHGGVFQIDIIFLMKNIANALILLRKGEKNSG